jgi:hypothetical protein
VGEGYDDGFDDEAGGGRFGLFNFPPESPLSRLRIYSYMAGVLSGIFTTFVIDPPPAGTGATGFVIFLIRALSYAFVIGLLLLVLRLVPGTFGRLIRSARRRRQATREARAARGEGGGDGGGGGRRRRSAPLITRGHLYGFLWGMLGAALLTYNVAPPASSLLTDFTSFLIRAISNLILMGLFIGGLGYLLSVFLDFRWITFGRHFGGYMWGTLLIALVFYSIELRPLTPDTPLLGGITGLCFIMVPLAEGYLLVRLLGRWRDAGSSGGGGGDDFGGDDGFDDEDF